MRHFLITLSAVLLLSGCNTIDGIGKDFGAIGQSFGDLFDGSARYSRAARTPSNRTMMQQQARPQPPMGGGGMGNPSMGMPPQFPPYSNSQNSYGGASAGYSGGSSYGAAAPVGAVNSYPYNGGAANPGYNAQPRPPAMPYYY
jgi:predicted small secreted protein